VWRLLSKNAVNRGFSKVNKLQATVLGLK